MVNAKKITLFTLALLIKLYAVAQITATAAAADEKKEFMRSNGKIYVVMAVVITILAGLLFYVLRLDRKMSKLEQGR